MLVASCGSVAAMARSLSETHVLTCIITLGPDGVFMREADGTESSHRAPTIVPVDTVGAGDAFVGALAATFDIGCSIAEALPRALAAGAITCTRHGAMTAPSAAEIDAFLTN